MAEGKTERILTLYRKMCDGEVINKAEIAESLQVDTRTIQRLVKPVGIMFSEFYFYLIAFIEEKEVDYLSPAIYRIDRIVSYEIMENRCVHNVLN